MIPNAVQVRMRQTAEIAIMVDNVMFILFNMFESEPMRILMWATFLFSTAFSAVYALCDLVWFRRLKASGLYYVVVVFCILSALSLLLNFSMDYRARIIIGTAVNLFIFYLFPCNADVHREVDFVFRSAYFILYFMIIMLFVLTVGIFLLGPYSILGTTYEFDGRLRCGLNPNIISSIALAAVLTGVYEIYASKRYVSPVILIALSLFLLLLTQTKTATYVLLVFASIFVFFIVFEKLRSVITPAVSAILALAAMVACFFVVLLLLGTVVDMILLTKDSSAEVIGNSAPRITSSINWSFSNRTPIWLEAIEYIADSPLLGVDTAAIDEAPVLSAHPHVHNQLLQIAVGSGVPCALLAVFIVVYYGIGFFRRIFRDKSFEEVFCFAVAISLTLELMFEVLFANFLIIFYFTALGFGTYLTSAKAGEE